MSDLQARLKDLPPEKLRLLARRLKKRESEPSLPVLQPAPEERHEPFPLTDVQQSLWVGRRDLFELGNVSTHGYWEMPLGELEVERLGRALRRLIERHEMLRAIILPDGRQQVLRVVPPYEVRTLDLRGCPAVEAGAKLAAVRAEMSHQVLGADRWPLFDIRASLLDDRQALIHVSFDFLIGDLWSFRLLIGELRLLYVDPAADLTPLDLSFRDYVLALKRFEHSETYRRSEAYWRERLPAIPPGPELPVARALRSIDKPRFSRRPGSLDPVRWQRLKSLAARRGLTPSGFLLTAYSVVLAMWSRTPRFTVNITNFNRLPIHPHIKSVIGDFASLTLLSVDFSRVEPFELRARTVQQDLWNNLEHGHLSAVRLMRDLARLEGRAPIALMPVVFTSLLIEDGSREEPEPHKAASDRTAEGAPGARSYGISQTPQIWLDHQVVEEEGSLIFNWDAVEDLFPPGLLDELFQAYVRLIARLEEEDAWREPGWAWLLTDQLQERALHNATDAPLHPGRLHTLVEEQIARRRDQPAVVAPDRVLSYGELDRLAVRLARQLRQHGARPDHLVAIVMEKSWEQVVAALAIQKSGAAYLPVDPHLPPDQLRYLIAHGQVEIALTQPRLDRELEWPPGVLRLVLGQEEDAEAGAGQLPTLEPWGDPRDLAYVLYTSGTTGLPKGVMIEHRSAVNRIVDSLRRFAVGPEDRVLALTALHHDMSVFDLFGALAAGATLIVPAAVRVRDPGHWAELMALHRVTIWNSVPAFLEMLVEYLEHRPDPAAAAYPSLRLAFLGGDWIPVTLPDRLRAFAPAAQPISVGGPTEATLWDIYHLIGGPPAPDWSSVPYGRPMSNTGYHVLNEVLEPCPDWVPGELCIAGAGVSRGYWRDPERTAVAFTAEPRTGERIYRSGDVGRYRPGGVIEFLGRKDFQVKIRGQRIELGGIERMLERHPRVRSAVVTAVGTGSAERRLVAYVVPDFSRPGEGESAADGMLIGKLDQLRFRMSEPGLRRGLDGRQQIPLMRPLLDREALAAYHARSSRRDFQPSPIPVERFGHFLSTLLGVEIAGAPRYRYPSSGGLHTVQAYLHVKPGRVEGLSGGTYYYHPREHALVMLVEGAELDRRIHVEVNRTTSEQAAFTLFLVSRLGAAAPFHGAQATDLSLLEAGAMGQLLMEAAWEDGIGLCPVGTLDFSQVAPWLALEEDDRLVHSFLGGLVAAGHLEEGAGDTGEPAGSGEEAPPPATPAPAPARRLSQAELQELQRSEPGLRRGDRDRPRLPLPGREVDPALYEQSQTHRDFLPEPLSMERLGRFLSALHGIRTQQWLLPKYRYPSAGGLYPVQSYLCVWEGGVDGLAAGTYYYHPRNHRLVRLAATARIGDDAFPAADRLVTTRSAFTLFLVGQLDAIRPRYGPWAREFCLLEAGYMSELLRAAGRGAGIGLWPAGSPEPSAVGPSLELDRGHALLHTLLAGALPWDATTPVVVGAPEVAAAPTPSRQPLEDELRAYLQSKLPHHMVPSQLVLLDALPLTPNGKVDRLALPVPAASAAAVDAAAPPRTELERQIAALVAEVLQLEKVGRNQSFFELGGNSVQLIQFYGKLLPLIGRDIPVVEVFNHPTVGLLAEYLRREESDAAIAPGHSADHRSDQRREGRDRLQQRFERRKARDENEDDAS